MMTRSKVNDYGQGNVSLSDSFLIEKIRYILDSPSQRKKFKKLKNDNDKLTFFLEHFIMTDFAIRQMENIYMSSNQGRKELLQMVDDILREIEEFN